MQFTLTDFIYDDSTKDGVRGEPSTRIDFGTDVGRVLCKWIDLGFNV